MNSEPQTPFSGIPGTDIGVIRRILVTTAILAALVALALWVYAGWRWAAGFAGGAVIGAANLVFLTALVREIVRPGRRARGRIAALLAVKVPVVYGGLAGLLIWKAPPAIAVVIGFTLVLVVIVLKAAGRALLDSGLLSHAPPTGRESQRGADR
jgi:hypothetical protein